MVQVPVLALPTPAAEMVHGVYCDDFAEYQSKDIPVRQFLGGFIPSNGVGTGYSRLILEKLAEAHENRIFDPACLTEDYENGYRIHQLGGRQLFVPIHLSAGAPIATREYFPRRFRAALRQRTRWTMGIALQSWERYGWRFPLNQLYWIWRDRKGLAGSLASPLANLLFVWGAGGCLPGMERYRWWAPLAGGGTWLRAAFAGTLVLSVLNLAVRAGCSARIYGWGFAWAAPLRAVVANWINCFATVLALGRYLRAKIRRQPLVWLKTEHIYPGLSALVMHKRRLGEVLVTCGAVDQALLEKVLRHKPEDERLSDYLQRTGVIGEFALYRALSVQQNLPFGMAELYPIMPRATRALPAAVARRWKVLPYRVEMGELYLASPEIPCEEMTRELSRFSRLTLRHHLVTASEYEELARIWLPKAG
jgi:adsorption protein B